MEHLRGRAEVLEQREQALEMHRFSAERSRMNLECGGGKNVQEYAYQFERVRQPRALFDNH